MLISDYSSIVLNQVHLKKIKVCHLRLVCLLTLVFLSFMLVSMPESKAMQKHQIYEETGSSHKTSQEYPVREYVAESRNSRYSEREKVDPREQQMGHEPRVSVHEPIEVPGERRAPSETAQVPREGVQGERAAVPGKVEHERGLEKIKERAGKEQEVVISPIPGVTFVETLIRLLDHELNGRFLGWRPNDLVIGRFTDNVNNFQLGLLEAARFTALRLKENLSRLGEADAYDEDLQTAVNLLMNKSTQFWFPSAESSYNEALKHLRNYLNKLKTGKAHFYYRVDTLIALISSYRDFLGNCTNTLVKDHEKDGTPVSWFKADDYFYYSQGAAYLIYEILKVVQVGFHEQLVTIDAVDIMEEAIHELHRATEMSPWIILDRPLDSLFANHRANLGAVLGEATHLLTVMTQF